MQRFVYSPKAFVYILNTTSPPESDSTGGGPFLHNISDLVVSGTVTRKINQVSTAEVVFRNPNRLYTQPGNPTFRPMDAITIFLQRLPGCPIQVFTGYLDETPYYQMYPGTATLRASCTLKRLQYKYFDPGLPFMVAFLNKFGWQYDPSSGGAMKSGGQGGTGDERQDANLSELIFAVMEYIGEWRPEDIYVEKLPQRLLDRLVTLYNTISEENMEATQEFEDFLKDFVGTGGSDSSSTSDPGSAQGGPANFRKFANAAGAKYNVDPAILMSIAETETNFYQNKNTSTAGAKGPMQFEPSTWATYGVKPDGSKASANDILSIEDSVYSAANYLDAAGFSKDMRKAIFAYNHADWYVNKIISGAAKFRGSDSKSSDSSNSSDSGATTPVRDPVTHQAEPDQTKDAPGSDKSSTSGSGSIIAPIAKQGQFGRGWHESSKGVHGQTDTSGHVHWHCGVDYQVPAGTPCVAPADGKITMAESVWSDGGMVHFKFTKDTGDIKAGTIIGWGHVVNIKVKVGQKVKAGDMVASSGNPGGGPHVHFILRTDGTDGGGDGSTDPVPILTALQKGETIAVDSTSSDSGSTPGDSALSAAKAAGLLTTFQFPGGFDAAESVLLTGDKSLMNDQPLLPFVQELCNGSMRSFMSLPNGDFYAWYPDYFNSFNQQPRWEIRDIEIIQGNIQLTDDNLATHVYVVGATLPDQNIEISRRLTTAGVVNVLNAGVADFLNIPEDPADKKPEKPGKKNKNKSQPFLGTMDATLQFLDKYGARPFVSEQTMIRSHIFETFYAFQTFMLMWSRQFLTQFQFTFMPELYPGENVRFPDHGISCFVEEVNHSWDYTSGFTTQANLSSPSATDNRLMSSGMVRTGIMGSSPQPTLPKPKDPPTPLKRPPVAAGPAGTVGDRPT